MNSASVPATVQATDVSPPALLRENISDTLTGFVTAWPGLQIFQLAFEYLVDSAQRSVLLLDVLRERGNMHFEHMAQQTPNVLHYNFELVLGGDQLKRPVNYGLVKIVPPASVAIDPVKRPFIVFDPRAGQGPGIGGMKHDSEIGVALANGHPCYFVGFTPKPFPGQTVEDVCRAQAEFVRRVVSLHPHSIGKPCLIGNCQAGWQIMMAMALNPDLPGPILLAGAPLSYWAGVHGKNPMRYVGGLLGGTWLTSLAGDLGHGIFDGAYLVSNFEYLNPANTYWEKIYNLYSKIDTEAPRFLEFEEWWGSPVLLNADEMQYIADELFIGNKLVSGDLFSSDGIRIDLRNIKSPIIVFCSWGDNITPPQQALQWVVDLYETDEQLISSGQTIIYNLHQSIGHLGIFVSAKVADKEHEEFAQAMDLMDLLPPGLYEAIITEKSADAPHADLVSGNYLLRFEARSLSNLRALGGNDIEDDLRFATVARISEINQGSYRTLLSPAIRPMVTDQSAELLRRVHPYRFRYEFFSDRNPFIRPIGQLADLVRAHRQPVSASNPFMQFQERVSEGMSMWLNAYRDIRDQFTEAFFMTAYGLPLTQAMVGLRSDTARARLLPGRDLAREAEAASMLADLQRRVAEGGLPEAAVRALIYILLGRPEQVVDERGFAILRKYHASQPANHRLGLNEFKTLVREQYLIVRSNPERAIAALPKLLAQDDGDPRPIFGLIRDVIAASGEPSEEMKLRLAMIERLFEARGVQTSRSLEQRDTSTRKRVAETA